ncbi:twitching motility protein PilJ [Nitrosomonas sp. Nm84]|uniref:methyl-accepting chemotaxis protein n=1 Tax=Nitrosomonas sp. Nm84 TaxID=200124 RepID=UPI000D75E9FF|nr:methyl-accepting chemotaxis protein [Nitrosomonas sp. Nm84]PXW86463.1 twitching motility protein PilJ [Nitrosomonas sp. Nm84]
MEEPFSKFRLTTGIAAIKTNLPVITLPVKKNVSKHAILPDNNWISGAALMLLMLFLLIAVSISEQKTRQSATQSALISQLQIQHLQLPRTAQQALSGSATAFKQLQDNQYQLNQYLTLLFQGGIYRHEKISPLSDLTLSSNLEAYHNNWQLAAKKIDWILSHQESLTKLAGSTRVIITTHSHLTKRIEALISRMIEIGNLSHEIKTIESIRIHAHSASRNIQAIFPNELLLAEISAQLAQDHAQISTIIQILSQGSNGLGAASDKDETIQDLLSHVYALMRKFDDHLNIIEKEIAPAMAAQSAVHQIMDNNDATLDMIKEFDHAVQAQATHTVSLLNNLIYALSAGLIITAIFFARSLRQNVRKQELVSRNEIETARRAIQTLLNDMKRIADGDLTVRTDITHHMTGAIADAINCTIEELHTLVEQVNQASALVVRASNQAQQVSSGLLTAAQQQSAKIEETTIAVLGMTGSITEVSDMATESAKVAKQSLATAEKGTLAVRESITGMNEIRTFIQDTSKRIKRLGESSQEIGEIVALITDITEQTNVLALNAALQATAAGEAGRGFTVIAQEVQRLAEKSAEASKQISELIITIQGDTQDAIAAMERSTLGVMQGAKRSDAAGRALEEIEGVSKQLAQLVTNIFDATNVQTRSAHQVVANMEEILHITRQNTEGTRQTTTSVKQITGFASELKASVSNFKV